MQDALHHDSIPDIFRYETLRFMKNMLESLVAARQLWHRVPQWRYGLGTLMKCVGEALIYRSSLPKSQHPVIILCCCSGLWMQRGYVPDLLLGGSAFFNLYFSLNNLHAHRMISVHLSYLACSAQPAMTEYKTQDGRWERARSWDIWFTDSDHKIIQIYWSEKLIKDSNITMELKSDMCCAVWSSSLWEITFSREMCWSIWSVTCKKTGWNIAYRF